MKEKIKSKYRRDTSKTPWKNHCPGLFSNHSEPYDYYKHEGITERLIKEQHKGYSNCELRPA